MSEAGGGGGSWTSMNENLMALLEAVLSLAASDAAVTRRPARPAVKPGGYSEDIFLDLSEEEQEEFSCSICYQVLKETMQCLNHHKFCHSCLYVWSTTGQYANRIRCPVCRCQGYYIRDSDLDERIQVKRVKCGMASCKWTGPLKHLTVHRHTTYGTGSQPSRHPLVGDDSDEGEEEEGEGGADNLLELPFLGRATPRMPHRTQSRFTGTGLQARTLMSATGTAPTPFDDGGSDPTVHTITTPLERSDGPSNGGFGGVLLRERRNANAETASGDSPAPERRSSVRQRVHPIRRSSMNRITVRHTDSNNNVPAAAPGHNSSPTADGEPMPRSSLLSPESALSSPRQPRPPSGPRPSHVSRRRHLPGLSGASRPRVPSGSQEASPPASHVIRAPPTFNATTASRSTGLTALNTFHNRLQESRDRLEGLMANFSGELERSRQEMADFQVERERQRREQLAEVRELGQRLGQVASELRHLLGNRRLRPSDSDD
ncbi:uncharacterized protein LOC143299364 [Babylonia areolata]|uniref:uncharacterized protein LOC143299364 n=1 Tax=Babylonia areolata TaxID=304850 RepID=UPI003FD66E2A